MEEEVCGDGEEVVQIGEKVEQHGKKKEVQGKVNKLSYTCYAASRKRIALVSVDETVFILSGSHFR
jgi:hypothetical protein